MGMYEVQELGPKIFYFTNSISEPKRLIEIIEEADSDDSVDTDFISKWMTWKSSNEEETLYGYQKMLNADYEKIGKSPSAKERYILNSFISNMKFCSTMYKQYNNIAEDVNIDTDAAIKKYVVGASMGAHADQSGGDLNLKYSLVAYLNDDYDGGELSFPNQNIVLKPKAGSIVIFPSGEPYFHESRELKSGTKYICAGFWMQ
jgi:hypothetical protein